MHGEHSLCIGINLPKSKNLGVFETLRFISRFSFGAIFEQRNNLHRIVNTKTKLGSVLTGS